MKYKFLILMVLVVLFFSCRTNQDLQLVMDTCYSEALQEEVRCGTFEVLENPDVQKGRKIKIRFIILPARTENPAPDPIFVFDGGPGVGAADSYEGWANMLHKLRDEREIVLIDQRGTGDSNPLPCYCLGDPEKAQTYLKDILPEDYVKNCRKELEKDNNLRFYHTVIAIRDTDRLRAALGYDKINLVGGSYGTNIGLLYMKHYTHNVRSVFFFSIAPTNWDYPASLAQDTEVALQRLFADCATDPDCAADYPRFKEELYELLESLKQGPVSAQITNPINNEPETVSFSYHNYIHIIRSLLYNNQRSRWIPAFIHWAYRGTWFPLVEYTVRSFKSLNEYLMDGMWLCVTCSESIPFINFEKAAEQARGTFMGTYRIDQQKRGCELWVRGYLPEGFLDLEELDVPSLIVSGEIDPVTPPYQGEIVMNYLANGLHIIVPNAAHGTGDVWDNCLDEVVVQFFSQGSVSGLDPSCVNTNVRPPFISWRDYTNLSSSELSKELNSLK